MLISTLFLNFAAETDIFTNILNSKRMKKLFFALMTVVAMTLTSCSGSTQAPGTVEATAEAPSNASEVAQALEGDLNNGNADTFKARITAIMEKVKELVTQNPQQATEYFTKAQEFLKANADKITALVGDNAEIKALVSTIADSDATQFVTGLISSLGGTVQQSLQDAAQQVAGDLQGAAQEVAGQVGSQVSEGVQGAVQDIVGGLLGGASQSSGDTPASNNQTAE